MAVSGRDTGPARLPGLPKVNAEDPALRSWISAVAERLEVREGARGNDAERVVTQREMVDLNLMVKYLKDPKAAGPGEMVMEFGPGFSATVAIKRFEDSIRALQLFKDLKKSLDDPSRFDDLRAEVREVLLRSIAEEAARRGAAITRTEKIIQDTRMSLAMQINEVTAAVSQAQAGVRETTFASAEQGRAQAGKITQLEASLGNYYQDGKPGRVRLEQQMTVTADKVEGLRGQYTLKIQAGGALAGFGLAATEKNGVPDSAFIIAANKFAIVDPLTYTGGLTNTPDNTRIPFGVDSYGIYMNSNVYVKGTMRVDTGGKRLIDGLRGSLTLLQTAGSWSDTTARQMVWSKLGNGGGAPNNNHLVIGDTVTIGSVTKTWNGSAWLDAGLFINGNVIVDGSVAAAKVDTNGLVVRDQYGQPLLGAGYMLGKEWVSGLGTMASRNNVRVGYEVTFPDGSTMLSTDFVNRLSRINSGNIGVFMDGAAITKAYIGIAEVDTLRIKGGSVTTMTPGAGSDRTVTTSDAIALVTIDPMPSGSSGVVVTGTTSVTSTDPNPPAAGWCDMSVVRDDGVTLESKKVHVAGKTFDPFVASITVFDSAPLDRPTTYYLGVTIKPNYNNEMKPLTFKNSMMVASGGKR